MTKVRILGAGRAGRSFQMAMVTAGLEVELWRGRSAPEVLADAASGVDALLIAVPDRYVATVAAAVLPVESTLVLHCSGSLGLDVLAGHARIASLHPLATLPDPVVGSLRLQGGAFFAVSGDQAATDLALALGGRPIVVAEDQRARYHAAACIASNHIVALLGQVQRVAAEAGLPLEAYLPLAKGALDDVAMLGPASALTGPASRGDDSTLDAHREVIGGVEVSGYDACVELAQRLAAGETTGAGAERAADRETVPAGAGRRWS